MLWYIKKVSKFSVQNQMVNISGFLGHSLSCKYSTLQLCHENSCRPNVNKLTRICANKTLYLITLKFEFHRTFCVIQYSFDFFNLSKKENLA